jgi:hypothetical protein
VGRGAGLFSGGGAVIIWMELVVGRLRVLVCLFVGDIWSCASD